MEPGSHRRFRTTQPLRDVGAECRSMRGMLYGGNWFYVTSRDRTQANRKRLQEGRWSKEGSPKKKLAQVESAPLEVFSLCILEEFL